MRKQYPEPNQKMKTLKVLKNLNGGKKVLHSRLFIKNSYDDKILPV